MYQPQVLILENWLSFIGRHEFKFQNGKTVLVQGKNLIDDGVESNGAGKSSLEEAVYYTHIGSSLRGVRDVDLINRGAESALVTIIHKNLKNNTTLTISREIFRKGSSKLKIVDTGDVNLKYDSVNSGNELILNKLGISLQDFQGYYVVNKDKYISFFTSSDAKKKDLIARFSQSDILNDVYPLLEKERKKFDLELQLKQKEEVELRAKLLVYEEELQNLEDEVDTTSFEEIIESTKIKIKESRDEITELRDNIITNKANKIKITDELTNLSEKLISIKLEKDDDEIERINSEVSSINIRISNIDDEIEAKKEERVEFEDIKLTLEKVVKHAVKCPNCNHEFNLGSDVSVSEALENIAIVEVELLEIEKAIKDLEVEKHNKATDKINLKKKIVLLEADYNDKSKQKRDLQAQINKLESDSENLQAAIIRSNKNIDNLEFDIKKYEERIAAVRVQIVDYINNYTKNKKEELSAKINSINDLLNPIIENINSLGDTIAKHDYWLLMYKKFRTYLSNKSLTLIQGYANMYLKNMSTNLQIKIEGYKQLANGETRENITPLIYRNGILEGEYKSFSGGERGRLEFAMMLALQQLINMSTESGGIDILIADEVFEGVDGVGISNMIDSAIGVNKTAMITTHVNVQRDHDVVTIQKDKEGSKILIN